MASQRKLEVVITGDAKGVVGAFRDVDKSSSGLGSKMASIGKAAAIGLGAAAVGAVALGKSFYDAAIESQKVTKQTDAVLKSMGNQAGVTSKQVADLSTKLSMQTGVDDELIQSGENVLLTFGKVRNEAGKGNDIFTRTTKVALDMSKALGTDLKGANIQLGKALNDPIKGITSLGRAGVSFSEDQKKAIKAMVESGDVLGAQKLILKEVESEFKGSAAAQATAGEKLKVVWGNLQETLGAKLIPVVEKAASFLADKLPGAMDAVGKAVGPVGKQIGAFWNTLTTGFTEDEGTPIERFALKVRAAVQGIVDWVQANWPKIQQIIGQVMTTVGSIIAGVVDVITTLWNNFGNNILEVIQRIWPRIQQIIEGALNIIQGIVKTVTALIHGDWSGVWEGIKQVVTGAWSAIQGIVGGALELLRGAIGVALEVIGSIFKGAWDALVSFLGEIPGRMAAALATVATVLSYPYVKAFELIRSVVSGGIAAIVGFVSKLPGQIASIAAGMWDSLSSGMGAVVGWIVRGLEGMVNRVIDLINDAIGAYNKIPLAPNISKIKHIGADTNALISSGPHAGQDPHHLALGGFVRARAGGIFANIGEGGQDEIVSPVPMLRQLLSEAFDANRGSSQPQVIQLVLDGEVILQTLIRAAERRNLRSGFAALGF